MSNKPQHPGEIAFFDGDVLTHTRKANEVPEDIRYVRDAEGKWVPIVKIVRTEQEDQVHIRQYSAGGMVMRSTLQVRSA